MKPLATGLLIAFGTVSLAAAGQTTATSTQPPAPQAQPDSPLVRAAKATQHNAPKKKKIVITNDTLARSGGHVSSSNGAPAALPPPPPIDPAGDPQDVQRKAALEAAKKARQDADEKLKREATRRANAILEGDDAGGIYEDPALSEGRAAKQSSAPPAQPPVVQVQKPPTSSR
jgi:hypothetical protein